MKESVPLWSIQRTGSLDSEEKATTVTTGEEKEKQQ